MPKKFELEEPLDLKLAATADRKSIALFVECRTETRAIVDIWVMKEHCVQNSWTKLVRHTPQGPKRILPEVVCFKKSGEVLVVHQHSRELVALDLVNNQFKLLGVSGGQSCNADTYEESLVLLDKNDAISY